MWHVPHNTHFLIYVKRNYLGVGLSIPLILIPLSGTKDKADVKTGAWFDKLTMRATECSYPPQLVWQAGAQVAQPLDCR